MISSRICVVCLFAIYTSIYSTQGALEFEHGYGQRSAMGNTHTVGQYESARRGKQKSLEVVEGV